MITPQKAEIARAEEGDRLVVHMRIVEREIETEAREAGVDRRRLVELQLPVIEHGGRIGNRRRNAVADRVHGHGPAIKKAPMEGLEPEAAVAVGQQHMVLGGDEGYTRGKAQLEDYRRRMKETEEAQLRVIQVNEKEKQSIRDAAAALNTSNSEMLKRIQLQTELLRANEETQFAIETGLEAEQNYLKAIEPLTKRINDIRAQGSKASEADLAAIPLLEQGIRNISAEYERQLPAIQAVISARIEELQAAKNLEIINAALLKQTEDRAAVESSVRDIILNGQERINEAYNQAAQQALPGIYGQLRAIADEENRIAEAAKRRVAEQFGNDTAGLNQAISQIDAASQVIIQRRQEAALAIAQEQSTFTAGWQKAFNDYAATAGSAADQAKNIFSTVTIGMEDAFVNFARTGKLSVKDLFKSIVDTILRSQVQQLLTRTFGSMGGGGGGGFFGNLIAGILANGVRMPSG